MITKGVYLDKEYVLGELYNRDDSTTIYRLTNICPNDPELVKAYPERRLRFTFTLELCVLTSSEWSPPREMVVTKPEFFDHITVIDLLQQRMKLDKFIVEETKHKGMT